MELVYWSVCLYSRRGGDGVGVGYLILDHCEFHFVREHEIWCKIQELIYPFLYKIRIDKVQAPVILVPVSYLSYL